MPRSRRKVLQAAAAAALGALSWKMQGLPWLRIVGDDAWPERNLLSAPVDVPSDFAGLHAHRWPVGKPTSPAPQFSFGAARSHDFDGAAWYRIHLAPHRYNWSTLDLWVAAHAAAGRTLVYTLYGTPAWLAERTDHPDLYGEPGGAAAPRDLAHLGDFISALVERYNGDGRRRLHFIETWNEPHFDGNEGGFWSGTAAQLVGLSRTACIAARQVDPGIRVLSPGFVGDLSGALSMDRPTLALAKRSSVYQYLTASDGHGGVGSHWCDGLAFHSYNVPWTGTNAGYLLCIRNLQAMLRAMQINLPLYNTELGFMPDNPFHNLQPASQATVLRRVAAMQAALGVQALFFYAFDDDLVGNPSLHPEIGEAVQNIHTKIAGRTLQQVTLLSSGEVQIATAEGTFLW